MTRFLDWPERLNDFLEGRRERPFSWGDNDCVLFAADAVLAMAGEDIVALWRGYDNEREALRRLRDVGGMRGLMEIVGLPEKPVGLAQRGDLVLVMNDGRETFGVVAGHGHWCGPGEDALVFRPLTDDEPVLAVYQV